jgi:hypothetical protein
MKHFTNAPALLFLLSSLLLSCATQKPEALSFEYLSGVYEHRYVEKGAEVQLIGSAAEYESKLKALGCTPQGKEMEGFDFEKRSLILLFGGTRPSSGYSIQTDSLIRTGKSLKLVAVLQKPGENCVVADMISYPMQLLAIDKPAKGTALTLSLKENTTDCQ